MTSVKSEKGHTHDVVGTPCCHGRWPAMEEVARAEPFLSLLMLVLSEWTIIMLDCAVAFCSLCLPMPSLQFCVSHPLALCYVKSECLCVRVFVFPHWFNFIKGFWSGFSCLGWHMFVQKQLDIAGLASWAFRKCFLTCCKRFVNVSYMFCRRHEPGQPQTKKKKSLWCCWGLPEDTDSSLWNIMMLPD